MSCSPECLAFMEKCYLEEEEKLLEAEIAGEEQDPTPEEARLLETMRKGFMGEIENLSQHLEWACRDRNMFRDQVEALCDRRDELIEELEEKEGRWEVGQAITENVIKELSEKLEQAEESLENAGYKWIESEGHYSCE